MLKIEHLSKTFKNKKAVNDICLDLENKTYGLIGPNGAGKTTLIRCIAGLYEERGCENITGTMRVGYLPQKFGVFRDAAVGTVMRYFAVEKKVPKKEVKPQIEECLGLVNLSGYEKRKVKTLSGGMVRRLGIAQALLGRPDVILLDEPTAGLDPEERVNIKMILNKIKSEKTIVISSHVLPDIEVVCDHMIVMNEGKILENAEKSKIIKYAEGKVFQVKNTMPQENAHTKIVGYTEDGTGVLYRVISRENIEGIQAAPTLEDGYLCMINGIA